jgi:neopullulanase
MIQGKGLTGAKVEISGESLQAGKILVNPAGTYLFVDITIDPQARPGPHPLKIITAEGTASAPFDVQSPLPTQGRFQGFSPDDVIYLIMPDRFADGDKANDDPSVSPGLFDRKKSRYYHGGDLQGIIDHLPYLKDLGVTALWMTPVYDNVNHLNHREKYNSGNHVDARGEPITDYHGYGAVDFYGVEEHFGDMAKLKALVDAAHKLGLKIIQDEVMNHTGPYHPWATNSPTPTWYNGTAEKHLSNNWQVWTLTVTNSPADQRKQTLEGWFIDILPDLNQNDEECSRYLIQNTLWWIGMTGLDGIRMDTLPYVPRKFWQEWRAAIKRQYPHVNVVGEVFEGDPNRVSFFQGGKVRFDGVDSGIESLFDFPLYYSIRKTFAAGRGMNELTNALAQDRLYVKPELLVTFLGLHDVNRFMSEPGADISRLKLAFTFLLTTRGIPMIYYGDELGMSGDGDPDNRRDFPGGFPGDARNAFDEAGRTPEEQSLFDHIKRLLHVRAGFEPLRHGRLVDLAVSDKAYAFARMDAAGTAIVLLNAGPEPRAMEFQAKTAGLNEAAILHDCLGQGPDMQVRAGKISVSVAPRSASIYTLAVPTPDKQ